MPTLDKNGKGKKQALETVYHHIDSPIPFPTHETIKTKYNLYI